MSSETKAGPPTLGRFKKLPLRTVWDSEAQSFTPWLAEEGNLAILAETLGLPELEVVQTEHPVGPFRADIVCRPIDGGQLILIENQIEKSDHTHLGQILTYASGLDAAVVVWVTERFIDEHRAAIDWFNRITADDFNFFGVEIEVWRIDNSRPAPRFNVVAEPNDWQRTIAKTARQSKASTADPVLEAYWTRLAEEVEARKLPLRVRDQPPRVGYYSFTLDRPRKVFLSVFRDVSSKRVGVYIGLYGSGSAAVFRRFRAEQSAIEEELGQPPSWSERKPGSTYHISLERPKSDPIDESDWPRQIAWMCDQLEQFEAVFGKRLAALPDVETLIAEAGDITEPGAT